MQQKVTALLPMKGHSERVPGKNIRDFGGAPLCMHILGTLMKSRFVDEIIVNTDSSKISDLVSGCENVKVVSRPVELCGDFVSMNLIIEHDLAFCKNEHIIQTHSTNPLLSCDALDAGIQKYFDLLPGHDSLFSVTAWQTRFYWPDGRPINHNPAELLRTQDLTPLYEENSCFYVFSKSSFAETGQRIATKPAMFPITRLEAVDIDEEEDFMLAEKILLANRD